MVRAKEGWNKGSLTDKSLFHLSTHCPGYKMEGDDLNPPPPQKKNPQTNKKTKSKKTGEGSTKYTRTQTGMCQGGEMIQARE